MTIVRIVLGVLVLLVIGSLFVPKSFELSASTTINAPHSEVRDYVKLLKNQQDYSVRVMADPQVQLEYTGTDGTIWATQSRDGDMKNVGKGTQKIINITEGKSLEVEIEFEKPMVATNYASTSLNIINNHTTQVTNIFRGTTPRPGNVFSLLFFPKLRKDMQQNMDNLKAVLEKK